jgi:hypothetical protein
VGLDDFVESEVAVAVAATAAVLSPRVRRLARSGAVYGLAGALIAADAVTSTARGFSQGTQQGAGGIGPGVRQVASLAGGKVQEARDAAGGVARSAAERVRRTLPTESGS